MTPPEKKTYRKEITILIIAFLVSRLVFPLFGLHFRLNALFIYWQYLDTDTLRHHLGQGLWFDHAQPPFFNFLLGLVLKVFGAYAPVAFALFFKLISLTNSLLLFALLKRTATRPSWLPLGITLLYLLSPALLIFETELFYTTFISMLLLISALFVLRLQQAPVVQISDRNLSALYKNVAGICIPLTLLCLTRSMYHLIWLVTLGAILLFHLRKTSAFRPLLAGFLLATLVVSGWYLKNYLLFKQFSASSWIGMNMARTVFHDAPVKDSSRIEAFEPFSDLHYYRPFLADSPEKKYAGLDDRDLLAETKSDGSSNLNAVGYIRVSQQYMAASKAFVRAHPARYLTNVLQSSILFFAPATRYPFSEPEAEKIKYYDLAYSFNLSHFATGKAQRRIAVVISALPKLLIYLAVVFLLIRNAVKQKRTSLLILFALSTIAYVFLASSLLEHYENMRFRYEIEPLFLLLLGQSLTLLAKPQKNNILE